MYRRSSIAPRISFSYFPHVSVDFHTFFQVIAANQMIERRDLTCYIKRPVAYDRHHSLADAPLVSICHASVFYSGLLSFCSPILLFILWGFFYCWSSLPTPDQSSSFRVRRSSRVHCHHLYLLLWINTLQLRAQLNKNFYCLLDNKGIRCTCAEM